jgi:hypothetical protein
MELKKWFDHGEDLDFFAFFPTQKNYQSKTSHNKQLKRQSHFEAASLIVERKLYLSDN